MTDATATESTCIDFLSLENNQERFREAFQSAKPFRYVLIDDFCHPPIARELARSFPKPDRHWIDASGINTRRKVTSPVQPNSVASHFFAEAQSPRFRKWLEEVTGIQDILVDPEYFGAGFHQTADGGYLNVHIDFNQLPNGLDRRLNLLVYMNEHWRPEWGGEVELWDLENRQKMIEVVPSLNRALIFETNEISYHGQPNPVRTGGRSTRNSFSIYYYTKGRPEHEIVPHHSTIYVNVHGFRGTIRNVLNMISQILTLRPLRRRSR